jgi:hypothetical protein
MTEQTEHKPDPIGAASQLASIMWDLAMAARYDDPHRYHTGRAIRQLRAALEALEGPAK